MRKSSSYLFKLENRNYTDKVMSKLTDENNKDLTDTKDVIDLKKETTRTYTKIKSM